MPCSIRLPGREAIHQRLTELLSIGSIGVPQIAGRYYFYTRREGMQNQPILYVRERTIDGADGPERVLVDANRARHRRHCRARLVRAFAKTASTSLTERPPAVQR